MWIYEQTTGKLFNPEGSFVAAGYAGGNCGKNPEGINNHDLQDCMGIGPLPVGTYTFSAIMLAHPHLGPFALPLIPAAGNAMFGRADFFMHGDTPQIGYASKGCIIMPRNVRLECARSLDRQLHVVRVKGGAA